MPDFPSMGPDSILSMAENSLAYMGDPEVLAKRIHQGQVGHAATFEGPFGIKQILYCDFIASGRSISFIEEYIQTEVLPLYANTHTTTTVTAQQTTYFRNEARSIIRGSVNASNELDAVIFTGSGCTGAIHKLISSLYLEKLEERPLVFVSGQEHHSNLLPWRESGCEMVTISDTAAGEVNIEDLERRMAEHRRQSKKRLIIGLFSAASNVSGILNDDLALTTMMHKYGGLAFWDYATAAPYVNIDMNPNVDGDEHGLCAKDAIYFSMHKFVGGPQTPGVLIAKKEMFRNPVPHAGGGGTVVYVTKKDHYYVPKIEDREEGGTPAIVESIRAGLVMHLKENIGAEYIMAREETILKRAKERLKGMENLIILGPTDVPKLPILSFLIKAPAKLGIGYLHHNFVCFILNDVFGIQARGGCACAGPYVEGLLGLMGNKLEDFVGIIQQPNNIASHLNPYSNANIGKFERIKPGFSRLSLPWFAPDEEIEYILDALEMLSKHGWKLLPQYDFNSETGEWQHHSKMGNLNRKWLNDIRLYSDKAKQNIIETGPKRTWMDLLHEAKNIFVNAPVMAKRVHVPDQRTLFTNNSAKIRWFILPFEAKQAMLMTGGVPSSRKINAPFDPRKFQPPKRFAKNATIPHKVGTYFGPFHITPILQNILAKSQRLKTPSPSYKSSASRIIKSDQSNPGTGKLWFQNTWLPGLMGSRKNLSASKLTEQNLSNSGSNHHENCDDEEEEQTRQYWNNAVHFDYQNIDYQNIDARRSTAMQR